MFDKKSVFELKSICRVLGIETNKNSKKIELLDAIKETGLSDQEILDAIDKSFDYKEADKKEVSIKVTQKEEPVEKKQEKVLLKMVHPRGALNVGNGVIFTFEEPFKLLSRAQADDIIRRAKEEVREATPEELAFFYGVDL
jgi:hypothetical protein